MSETKQKYYVAVQYMATYHYVVEADSLEDAETLATEWAGEDTCHDYNLYDITSSSAPVDAIAHNSDWED